NQFRQALWRVLSVSVNQRHEVESFTNGVIKTDLLITAIALVNGIAEHCQGKSESTVSFNGVSPRESFVLRRVVDDQDFRVIILTKAARYALKNALDRALCVVRHDKDQQPWFVSGIRHHDEPSCYLP